jgi:dTDP-4-dehydrorhamnose reductase
MRVLVIGASGQLGRALYGMLKSQGNEVIGTYNTGAKSDIKLDITDYVHLEDLIIKSRPDVIINCAAMTDVDGCEVDRKRCYAINAEAVRHMARASRVVGSYLIHVSTDYVFDGEKGMYREEEEPNPVNYYGLAKLLGEAYALSYDYSIVIRTSGVYSGHKSNFPRFVIEMLSKGQQVNAIEDSWYSPIHSMQLAQAIAELIVQRRTGILNIAGSRVSRYDFALKIAEATGLPKELVRPVKLLEMKWKARRPRDSSLDVGKASSYLSSRFYDLTTGIRLLVEETRQLGLIKGFSQSQIT